MIERTLRTVEAIPPGRVVAYGQLGAIIGIGPRQAGRIMSEWGSGVPWWRVTNTAGELPAPLRAEAFAHWDAEGVARKPNGRGCRIAEHGADLVKLREDAERAWADLPAPDGQD